MRLLIIGFASLSIFSPLSAQAYIDPSFYQVRTLARKHASFDREKMVFRHRISFYKGSGDLSKTFMETLSFPTSNQALIKITDEAGHEVARQVRKLSTSDASSEYPVAYDLLFTKDSASLYEHLKLLGLPLKTERELYSEKDGSLPYIPEDYVSLQKPENRTAIVIQSKSGPSQLWLDKDGSLPIKAVFPNEAGRSSSSDLLEYRFHDQVKPFFYPRQMQVLRQGHLWVKIETIDVKTGSTAGTAYAPEDGHRDLNDDLRDYLKWIR